MKYHDECGCECHDSRGKMRHCFPCCQPRPSKRTVVISGTVTTDEPWDGRVFVDGMMLLRDQVLIRPDSPKDRTKSGLWVPSGSARRADEAYMATVLAVGPGVRRKDGTMRPVEARPGDRVLLYWAGSEMVECELPNGDRILKESLIQAVLA